MDDNEAAIKSGLVVGMRLFGACTFPEETPCVALTPAHTYPKAPSCKGFADKNDSLSTCRWRSESSENENKLALSYKIPQHNVFVRLFGK